MGGGSFSETWANSIIDKNQIRGYSANSCNIRRYAVYNDPVNAKERIIPLIKQYIEKKKEIRIGGLSKKHEELFAIIRELLDTLKEIDKQQTETLTERYEQLKKECEQLLEENNNDILDKINKRYMDLLDEKLPNIELKLEQNHEIDFLVRLDFFIQWLDETLKNYKLYTEEQENREEEIKTAPTNRKSFLARFKGIFEER